MSNFTFDIFGNLEKKGIVYDGNRNPMYVSVADEKPHRDVKKLLDEIKEYSQSFNVVEDELYKYSKIAISTTKNIYGSVHIMQVWLEFFIQTIKHLHPELDVVKLEDFKKEIKNILPKEEKDNELMIPVMLGFLEKML